MQLITVELHVASNYNSFVKQAKLPTIPASEIYKALRHTPAGKSLRANLRYSPFRHNTEDAKHWLEMLGPSAVTYSHMKHVYKITKKALELEQKISNKRFGPIEQETLLLAALSHDFGEAILDDKSVGDIPAPKKDPKHEKTEQLVFKQVLKSLKLDPKLKLKMWKCYRDVCHNKSSRLYKFFHLIEHIDYMDTGIRVCRNISSGKNKLKQSRYLIGQILTFSIPLLVDDKKNNYDSTRSFIVLNKETIHEMFEYCIVEYRKAQKQNQVILGIDSAYSTWRRFLMS